MPARFLEKPGTATFIPGTPGAPGSPGRPPRPPLDAYCAVELVEQFIPDVTFLDAALATPQLIFNLTNNPNVASVVPVFGPAPPGSGLEITGDILLGFTITYLAGQTVALPQTVCYEEDLGDPGIPPTPPVPPTPSQWAIQENFGWNSGAESVARRDGTLSLEFTPLVVGAQSVGLSRARRSEHYRDIDWAFVFRGQQYEVYYRNERMFGPLGFNRNDRFAILRSLGRPRFYRNRQLVYTGPPDRLIRGSMVVVAALYAPGERVV